MKQQAAGDGEVYGRETRAAARETETCSDYHNFLVSSSLSTEPPPQRPRIVAVGAILLVSLTTVAGRVSFERALGLRA